jgi:hypothetical protein
MKSRSLKTLALLGLGVIGFPFLATAQADQTRQGVPGTVNYVEGRVFLNASNLTSQDVGNAVLGPGQEITTAKGKAEVLLTPGVFLRLDNNSAVKMISPDLALTQVELDKGRAAVEVDEIHDQNDLQVIDAGVTTRLNKRGYYEFDANQPEAMVFNGEAHVQVGDNKWRKIKGHHELALNEGPALQNEKPADFNKNDAKDQLYNWNSLRSEYMAEANNQMADNYAGPYAGPGWYWDPWGYDYAYMGFGPFASPFGFGFYPFGWGAYYHPYWGGGYYHGGYRRGHVGTIHHGVVGANRGTFEGFHNSRGFEGFRNGGAFSGFHGGGGFHGGAGGGFHGGGGHH